jgi:SAM-dependent methyltransferase
VKRNPQQSTPPYFRYIVGLLRRLPNFDQPFIGRLRRTAVALLELPDGARVLDVGCGTGASFPHLLGAVGEAGEVVGVEFSPDVASVAQRRIDRNRWTNVRVVVGDARTVVLSYKFDGLLLFGAPDIYASPEAIANLRPYLKDGARVVAFGSKLSERRFGAGLNVVLESLMKLSFASTPKLTLGPWTPLETHFVDLKIQEYIYGGFFLASGSLRP